MKETKPYKTVSLTVGNSFDGGEQIILLENAGVIVIVSSQ
jgi:hypothetical protein